MGKAVPKGSPRQIPLGGSSFLGKVRSQMTEPFLKNLFGVGVAAAIMVVMIVGPRDVLPNYRVGDVASESYYASFDFEVVDEERTQILRETAAARVPPFFQYDERVLRNALADDAIGSLKQPLVESLRATLQKPIFSEDSVQFVLGPVVRVRGLPETEEDLELPFDQILQPRDTIQRLLHQWLKDGVLEDKSASAIRPLLDRWIQPNLVYSAGLTEAWRQRAADEVLPLVATYRRGQCLIRQGETFTDRTLAALRRFADLQAETEIFSGALGKQANDVLGIIILVLILFVLAWMSFQKNPRSSEYPLSRQIVLGMALVLVIMGMKTSMIYWNAKTQLAYFVLTMGLLSLIVTALESWLVAASLSFFLACLGGIMLRGQLGAPVVGGVVSLFGALSMQGTKKRSDLLKVGGIMIFTAVFAALGMGLWAGTSPSVATSDCAHAAMGAILAVALTPIGLWAFESLFASSTDITLLELSDLRGQTLLRQMDTEAPGSYEHSLVVSNLAEMAASSVRVNALRAKVGALYHDIGKMGKPEYFIENARQGRNKHAKLSPSMSALILISHVKDGVKLAQEARLPKEIVDIIQQHHGTSVISYFYDKAVSQDTHGAVREEEFRYSGPKPQTAEAAVVMLADSVEAATRSLDSRSETRIRRMVRDVVDKKLSDGQLDESPLTLKDITAIVDALARVLIAFYHGRIEYPEESGKEKSEENHGGSSPE